MGANGYLGRLWGSMGILWVPMGTYGTFGDLWRPLGSHGDPCGPLGPFGDLWGHIGTHGAFFRIVVVYFPSFSILARSFPTPLFFLFFFGRGGHQFFCTPFLTPTPPPPSSKHHTFMRHITHLVVYAANATCDIRHQASSITLYTQSCPRTVPNSSVPSGRSRRPGSTCNWPRLLTFSPSLQ